VVWCMNCLRIYMGRWRLTRKRWRRGTISLRWLAMSGSVGSPRRRGKRRVVTGSNGGFPTYGKGSDGPAVGRVARTGDSCSRKLFACGTRLACAYHTCMLAGTQFAMVPLDVWITPVPHSNTSVGDDVAGCRLFVGERCRTAPGGCVAYGLFRVCVRAAAT